jgi:ParB family transcriptional regulator, chromosome partitioning protein
VQSMSVTAINEKPPKRALGRGLSALIPQAAPPLQQEAAPAKPSGPAVIMLPIEAIERDPRQPRHHFEEQALKELADSIKAQGILQPLLVRKDGANYQLIAGERRWRAAQLAGLKEVPTLVRDVTPAEAFELALVENLQRSDLNPIEEAQGYQRLIEEFGLTQEQVSFRVGKERSTVTNALRLLGLPEEVKKMVAEGVLNMGHARALLGIPRIPEMVALAERIAAQKLSVREAERLVKVAKVPPNERERAPKSQNVQARQLVEDLQRALGTKVRLVDRGGQGTLEIDYFSYADLDRLVELIRR